MTTQTKNLSENAKAELAETWLRETSPLAATLNSHHLNYRIDNDGMIELIGEWQSHFPTVRFEFDADVKDFPHSDMFLVSDASGTYRVTLGEGPISGIVEQLDENGYPVEYYPA